MIEKMASRSPESNRISKKWWMSASAAAAAVLVFGAVVVLSNDDESNTPTTDPTTPDPTLAPVSEREEDAIDERREPDGDPSTLSVQPAETMTTQPVVALLTRDSLTGYWTNVGGRTSGSTALLVDFRRDGSFTIGNSGALGAGSFAGGTYDVDGDTIVFTGDGGGCDGETFVWTTTAFTAGRLEVDVIPNGGCAGDAGWTWVRVSPASPDGLDLTEGTSGATPSRPETVFDLVGIWLRLGTGEVLAIDARGSYLFTSIGNTLSPDDRGLIQIEAPGVVVLTSDGSGACEAEETWMWTAVATAADLLRDGNPRGTTMRTGTSELCGTSESASLWRLLSPDLVRG